MAGKSDPLRVLAVDDDPQTLKMVQRTLSGPQYKVRVAGGVEAALGVLEFRPVDLVVSAVRMPRVSGLALLRHVRENLPGVEIILMTARPCIEEAVNSIKEGAEGYLAKPFTGAELLAAVEKTADKLRLRRAAHPETRSSSYGIIGQSPGIQRVFSLIRRAAAVPATVLIRGESGTGKELVARAIHHAGDRASAPFVSVNCSAIPDTLLESELFGHQRGAFTGARESRAGYFRLADGGTVFLDEIGDASAAMQARLLRVLQNKEIQVVGERRPRHVDTRIIAATHKTLPDLVAEGLFREDLFYRLNVIDIWVPPLRERTGDIFPLLEAFLRKFCEEMGRATPEFSDDALQAIRGYAWPGNVRELENVVHRLGAVVDAPEIHLSDLPDPLRSPSMLSRAARPGLNRTLAEVEAEHIAAVLAENQGNKTRTAEILGIDRKTLRLKLRRLGLA